MPKRLCIIGLDGVGLGQARLMAGRGEMPGLGALLENGSAWPVESPLPEMSPVCWGTMFSGLEPGEHGVFGFGMPVPGRYRVAPVDSKSFHGARLWDLATRRGLYSLVLNVPLTYPAGPVNGVMLSGFVAPDLRRGVFPAAMYHRLAELGYRAEADADLGRERPGELLKDLEAVLSARLKVFRELFLRPWDVFIGVFTETDRINHFLWDAVQDESHALAPAVARLHRMMDGFIAWAAESLAPEIKSGETALMVVSDHSFGPIESEVYLNPWLAEQGFLRAGPKDEILAETSALALDPGRIHLHRGGIFPMGREMGAAKQKRLCAEISRGLLALKTPDGRRPVEKVLYGSELYHGSRTALAPDLLALAAPGFSLRAGMGKPGVFGKSHLRGVHRPEGALALWAGGEPAVKPERMTGLMELMTGWLGIGAQEAGACAPAAMR